MRNLFLFAAPSALAVALASNASAETWYASPEGTLTTDCSSRATPCSLGGAAAGAVAGDTVILMDGVYDTSLWLENKGTPEAWITFQADECATPIIQGPGPGPSDDDQSSGVGGSEVEYVRFIGLVVRGWNIGFGNGWTGSHEPDSNGHWYIENCIAESNGRTGFTFFSAEDFHLKNSIAAHNGSSTLHSWSSGVTLYAAPGGSVVEGVISFENMDGERHTDGSGFIVDESSHDAKFFNNIAFRNGGSCLRLTRSTGTTFINNTCWHNAQDPAATGPTNPSELYFTSVETNNGVQFLNNILVNTGEAPRAANAVVNQPTTGWTNNVIRTGATDVFTSTDAADFTLSGAASALFNAGSTGGEVPTEDIGFDPKCIVKRAPELVGNIAAGSWWEYSVDFEYIKSIGGVGNCFNPQARSAGNDIGAYVNAAVSTVAAGSCEPSEEEPPPEPETLEPETDPGTAGASNPDAGAPPDMAGASNTDGGMPPVTAGASNPDEGTAGTAGASSPDPGNPPGATAGAGGTNPDPGLGMSGAGGTGGAGDPGLGTPSAGTGGVSDPGVAGGTAAPGDPTLPVGGAGGASGAPAGPVPAADAQASDSGCGCRVTGAPSTGSGTPWLPGAALALLGLSVLGRRRVMRAKE